jgi:hypothetical protein
MSQQEQQHEEEYSPTQEQVQLKNNFRILQERIDSLFKQPEERERRRREFVGTLEHFLTLMQQHGPEYFLGEGWDDVRSTSSNSGGDCPVEEIVVDEVTASDHTCQWCQESDWPHQEDGSEHGEII